MTWTLMSLVSFKNSYGNTVDMMVDSELAKAFWDMQSEVTRLREVERKALEQSEYIQTHGLTEYELAQKDAEIERLRKALQTIADGNPPPRWKSYITDMEMAAIARAALASQDA